MSEPLHLVRLVLDRRALARVATRHRLSHNIDEGYFLHAGLAQLFATSTEPATVPLCSFAVDDVYAATQGQPDQIYVLGYAREADDALVARMGPARGDILRLCKSREMPALEAGQAFAFRTRVCPIVRTKVAGDRPLAVDRRGKVKSREHDAFVHATLGLAKETFVSRETVYVDWLRKQLEADGACALGGARLAEFRRDVMRRRGGEKPMERPNAVLEGTLTVTDPAAFRATLARGLGRHRAFGFGMLLLRPPAAP
jgi:CRISPR system Cascade subunit CasE